MDADTKKKTLTRLKKIEGQTAALRRMVEDDAYCVDTLLQLSAAQGALGRVGEIVLASHIETCVAQACEHGSAAERREKIDELMTVFRRYGGRFQGGGK